MAIVGMNHFTVLSDNLDRTKSFYMGLLGLTEGFRPNFTFPGAWLYSGNQAVLHVIAGRALPSDPQGVLDHMAFSAKDLPATAKRLRAAGIDYELRKIDQPNQINVWQLFCYDPSGARVELDFDGNEPAPDA
jgi:catechol 2,3-dioxygenase-like lactoylglutathione lyase family enzyme